MNKTQRMIFYGALSGFNFYFYTLNDLIYSLVLGMVLFVAFCLSALIGDDS